MLNYLVYFNTLVLALNNESISCKYFPITKYSNI